MLTPFDEKSPLARRLDRIAGRVILLLATLALALYLYLKPLPTLLGGGALYAALLVLLALWEKAHLQRKETALRQRIGGALAMEALSLLPQRDADAACAQYLAQLCPLTDIQPPDAQGVKATLGAQTLLIRCVVMAPGEAVSAGAVLSAERARIAAACDRAVLCTTTHFSAHALELAEQSEPPVRTIDSAVLRSVCGRLHPATDAQLAALGKRKRSPFSWPRLKLHAFSPNKKRRYLIYALALLILFLLTDRLYYLLPAALCFLLALGAHRASQQPFRL